MREQTIFLRPGIVTPRAVAEAQYMRKLAAAQAAWRRWLILKQLDKVLPAIEPL